MVRSGTWIDEPVSLVRGHPNRCLHRPEQIGAQEAALEECSVEAGEVVCVETIAPATPNRVGLTTLMSTRRGLPKRVYPWAWRPAMRGFVSKLVARTRKGTKTRLRNSTPSGLPVACSRCDDRVERTL
jgi:hypothetical protein